MQRFITEKVEKWFEKDGKTDYSALYRARKAVLEALGPSGRYWLVNAKEATK